METTTSLDSIWRNGDVEAMDLLLTTGSEIDFDEKHRTDCYCECQFIHTFWSRFVDCRYSTMMVKRYFREGSPFLDLISPETLRDMINRMVSYCYNYDMTDEGIEEAHRTKFEQLDYLLDLLYKLHPTLLQNSPVIQRVFYDNFSDEEMRMWYNKLKKMGVSLTARDTSNNDYYRVWRNVALGGMHDILRELLTAEMNENGSKMGKTISNTEDQAFYSTAWDDGRTSSTLIHIICRWSMTKNISSLEGLRQTCLVLLEFGIDINFVDHKGYNVHDYLAHYNFLDVWSADPFKGYTLPALTTPVVEDPRDDSNPHPVTELLYDNRYCKDRKDVARVVNDMYNICNKHGWPNLSAGGHTEYVDSDTPPIRHEYCDLANLIQWFGWSGTVVVDILQGKDKDYKWVPNMD